MNTQTQHLTRYVGSKGLTLTARVFGTNGGLLNYSFDGTGRFLRIPNKARRSKAMKQLGVDISKHESTKINSNNLNSFDLVITLCSDARDKCPVLNVSKHIHWNISDPANFNGSDEEKTLKLTECISKMTNLEKLYISLM